MHLLLDDMANMQMQFESAGNQMMHMLMIVGIVAGIVGLFMIICMWIIFTKAGKPGWASIVPIYSTIVLLEIIGKPWTWLLLIMFVPIYNIILLIKMINLLSKSFGQGVGFTLGLLFVPIIFYPMLAFSKNMKYVGPGGAAAAPQA